MKYIVIKPSSEEYISYVNNNLIESNEYILKSVIDNITIPYLGVLDDVGNKKIVCVDMLLIFIIMA